MTYTRPEFRSWFGIGRSRARHIHLPQPESRCCPYTTLFRTVDTATGQSTAIDLPPGNPNSIGLSPQIVLSPEDRKSTRLNSSHVKISYAVFCLKKTSTLSVVVLQVCAIDPLPISKPRIVLLH